MSSERNGVTLSERLRVTWPVMIVLVLLTATASAVVTKLQMLQATTMTRSEIQAGYVSQTDFKAYCEQAGDESVKLLAKINENYVLLVRVAAKLDVPVPKEAPMLPMGSNDPPVH